MKEKIIESAQLMGLPEDMHINAVFDNMKSLIGVMKSQLDIRQESE